MKKGLILLSMIGIGVITGFVILAIGFKIGYNSPPYKLKTAKLTENGQYHLQLINRKNESFGLTVPIEKASQLGLDIDKIIILSNL